MRIVSTPAKYSLTQNKFQQTYKHTNIQDTVSCDDMAAAAAAAVIPSSNSGTTAAFRKLLPIAGNPRFSTLAESTAQKWYNDKKDLPALKDFLSRLEARNLVTPFRGLTSDGNVQPNLFNYAAEEGAPIGAMLEAAKALLGFLSPEQRQSTLFDSVENQQIRLWSNPEFYVNEGK